MIDWVNLKGILGKTPSVVYKLAYDNTDARQSVSWHYQYFFQKDLESVQ